MIIFILKKLKEKKFHSNIKLRKGKKKTFQTVINDNKEFSHFIV